MKLTVTKCLRMLIGPLRGFFFFFFFLIMKNTKKWREHKEFSPNTDFESKDNSKKRDWSQRNFWLLKNWSLLFFHAEGSLYRGKNLWHKHLEKTRIPNSNRQNLQKEPSWSIAWRGHSIVRDFKGCQGHKVASFDLQGRLFEQLECVLSHKKVIRIYLSNQCKTQFLVVLQNVKVRAFDNLFCEKCGTINKE